jgi:hypothetical protein
MHQTITFSCFCDAFRSMDRQDQFTYDGKRALFDYLEELEEDIGQPIELDVIALCCEYSEYDSPAECAQEFGWVKPEREAEDHDPELPVCFWTDAESDEDYAERCNEEALEWLRDRTTVIEHDSGIIIQDF